MGATLSSGAHLFSEETHERCNRDTAKTARALGEESSQNPSVSFARYRTANVMPILQNCQCVRTRNLPIFPIGSGAVALNSPLIFEASQQYRNAWW